MQAIRQFQEERQAWEAQREQLEIKAATADDEKRELQNQKWEVEQQLAHLHAEVASLRRTAQLSGGSSASAGVQQGPQEACESVRKKHESQLALMAMVDDLRNDLQREQHKSRSFEKRASDAEQRREELRAELDRVKQIDLDVTQQAQHGTASERLREELLEARRGLEKRTKDVQRLEDDTLKLREELNGEKQKVLELKKAAHNRGAAWKDELGKITEELGVKERLEQEVVRLRADAARWRKELEAASSEAEGLRKDLVEARAARTGATKLASEKMEEMDLLSNAIGGQLMAVESELREQTQKSSRLLELFLQHSHGPMQTLRRSCRRIAASGEAGEESRLRQVPPIFEADIYSLQDNLVKMVNLLRYLADVHEAREELRGGGLMSHREPSYREHRQHSERPVQPEASLVSQLEDTLSNATRWLQSGLA